MAEASEDNELPAEAVREIAQITFYLANEGQTFDAMIDLDATESEKQSIRTLDFVVDETNCRFVYFETVSHRRNPPWLEFINERAPDACGSACKKNPVMGVIGV